MILARVDVYTYMYIRRVRRTYQTDRQTDSNCTAKSLSLGLAPINPGDRARPASVAFEFVTVVKWRTIPMLNKKTLDMQRLEVLALVNVRYAHVDFLGDLNRYLLL